MTRLGRDHFINNPIIPGLFRRHEKVTIAIFFNLILRLPRIVRNVRVKNFPNKENFLGLNFNVCGLSLCSSERLVDHDASVGEGTSLSRSTGTEQEGSHTSRHAEADGRHVAGDVLHGIVNGHSGTDRATRGIDVESNVLGGVFVGKV